MHLQPDWRLVNDDDKGVGEMAELTNLETKLGEVIGLAMAAQTATGKVRKLVQDEGKNDLALSLQTMAQEAAQAEKRAVELAGEFEGKKTAILTEARTVKKKATEMMRTYLDEDADALDGFEFLTMAEASEVGHWAVLRKLNEKARHGKVGELVDWQLPIQQRHLREAMVGSVELAGDEDPNATS
jgi:hypothetical protein